MYIWFIEDVKLIPKSGKINIIISICTGLVAIFKLDLSTFFIKILKRNAGLKYPIFHLNKVICDTVYNKDCIETLKMSEYCKQSTK